jgi:hypothetical protein
MTGQNGQTGATRWLAPEWSWSHCRDCPVIHVWAASRCNGALFLCLDACTIPPTAQLCTWYAPGRAGLKGLKGLKEQTEGKSARMGQAARKSRRRRGTLGVESGGRRGFGLAVAPTDTDIGRTNATWEALGTTGNYWELLSLPGFSRLLELDPLSSWPSSCCSVRRHWLVLALAALRLLSTRCTRA